MIKHTDPATLTPEQRQDIEDGKFDKEINEGYAAALGRISDVFGYLKGRVESEVAYRQRRSALVASDELARLGAIAFTGVAAEYAQHALDSEISRTVSDFFHIPSPGSAEQQKRHTEGVKTLLCRIFGDEGAADVQDFIRRRIERVAEYGGRSDTPGEPGERGEPTFFNGVWASGATYRRGSNVLHAGTMWFCRADATTDRPGSSHAWQMTSKTHGKHDRHETGVSA
ncbi:MAG: hypothetical protein H0T48_12565 [Gemmatimonadaceae bacterium]|nr:hypothetical protein [Gemmatimonadaceae bacterium]